MKEKKTHLSAGDLELDLTTGSRGELGELLADAAEQVEAVVLGEGVEEVLDGGAAGACLLGELGDDGRLVGLVERRGGEDGGQLRVLLDQVAQGGEGLCGRVEGRRLGGGRVLVN